MNRLLAAALRQPRRTILKEALPEDPDWKIIRPRRREPLANFDTYHRERFKKTWRRKSRGGP